jgi:hypothetical protein
MGISWFITGFTVTLGRGLIADKLRLDLETLEVERLDIAVAGLNGSLETFGMGHASTELGQSCEGQPPDGQGASCNETECDCED